MKKLLPLLCLAVAGCASAPSQHYRPAGSDDAVSISGHYNSITGQVDIFMNGETVISEKSFGLAVVGADAEFSGEYNGLPVSAYCHEKTGLLSQAVQCMVFVNNERAATLTF